MKRKLPPWMRKLILFLIAALTLQAFFAGVRFLSSKKISLHQPEEEIAKIELGYSPWYEDRILYTLDKEEYDVFLESLTKIRWFKSTSPQGDIGSLHVQITYSDDSVEMIGVYSSCYKSAGIHDHGGWYYIPEEDLYELFSNYCDLSALPYLSH